jgi:hypothetical protein
MKTKLLFLLAGLAVSGLVLNGCYTQMARPDREDEPNYAEESESAEVVAGESEEASAQKEADMQRDDHRRTNVYIYGGGWYGSPWYPYGYPYWYDPYPRSGFYVSIGYGYGYYDQWNWCGTAWNWYDPWCHDYYSGFWGPSYGWRPAYYYPPYYYPYYGVSDNGGVPAKKRSIGRRGSTVTDDLPSGTYTTGSTRGTLFRPASSTYTRDNDGSYRRIRRDAASSSGSTVQRAGSNDKSTSKQGQPATNGRRVSKRGSGNDGNSNRTTVSRGSSGNNSGRSGHSGSSGSSGSGGSVSKPSGSGSSGGSAPRSSSGSSSSGTSSGRRTRN